MILNIELHKRLLHQPTRRRRIFQLNYFCIINAIVPHIVKIQAAIYLTEYEQHQRLKRS